MKITALAGGVGGAKLSQGLAEILNESELSIIVNTADDFEILGLFISPDLDTVCYTLGGIADPVRGWGIQNDTFVVYERLKQIEGPDWFLLGDNDLATHLARTQFIRNGKNLTEFTDVFRNQLGIKHPIYPMSNERVSTIVSTVEYGPIPFQEYFVKYRYQPAIIGFKFDGIEEAIPTKEVIQALENSDAIVICPSNPFVSIDPIISLHGIREILEKKFVVCVSPIIQGKAVKGPLDKMFIELGIQPSPKSVLKHYSGLVDCFYVDKADNNISLKKTHSSIIIEISNILIPNLEERKRLAIEIINKIRKSI